MHLLKAQMLPDLGIPKHVCFFAMHEQGAIVLGQVESDRVGSEGWGEVVTKWRSWGIEWMGLLKESDEKRV